MEITQSLITSMEGDKLNLAFVPMLNGSIVCNFIIKSSHHQVVERSYEDVLLSPASMSTWLVM